MYHEEYNGTALQTVTGREHVQQQKEVTANGSVSVEAESDEVTGFCLLFFLYIISNFNTINIVIAISTLCMLQHLEIEICQMLWLIRQTQGLLITSRVFFYQRIGFLSLPASSALCSNLYSSSKETARNVLFTNQSYWRWDRLVDW